MAVEGPLLCGCGNVNISFYLNLKDNVNNKEQIHSCGLVSVEDRTARQSFEKGSRKRAIDGATAGNKIQ